MVCLEGKSKKEFRRGNSCVVRSKTRAIKTKVCRNFLTRDLKNFWRIKNHPVKTSEHHFGDSENIHIKQNGAKNLSDEATINWFLQPIFLSTLLLSWDLLLRNNWRMLFHIIRIKILVWLHFNRFWKQVNRSTIQHPADLAFIIFRFFFGTKISKF